MDELKSSWEIAQERANRLGGLSTEEKERQERQRYGQIGHALAQKWLDGPQEIDMTAELNKHKEKERDIMKQAVVEHLAKAIEFTPAQGIARLRMVVEAISSLGPELQPKAEEITQLLQEYQEAEQKISQQLEGDRRETLHKLRISGTAVDVANIEAGSQSYSARQGLIETFAPRLNALKQALIS
jgi:hypothetical protein